MFAGSFGEVMNDEDQRRFKRPEKRIDYTAYGREEFNTRSLYKVSVPLCSEHSLCPGQYYRYVAQHAQSAWDDTRHIQRLRVSLFSRSSQQVWGMIIEDERYTSSGLVLLTAITGRESDVTREANIFDTITATSFSTAFHLPKNGIKSPTHRSSGGQ